jgi:hypothetical protein
VREAERFADATQSEPGDDAVILARAADGERASYWSGIPMKHFWASHSWITGASGAGKTYFVIGLLAQVLRRGQHPIIVVDLKGELAAFMIEVLLPALVHVRGLDVLRDLRIVRPFDREFLPQLRVTLPETGIDRDAQAMGLTTAIEQGLASEIGTRMARIFLHMIALAIELNEPLTMLKHWMVCPALFQAAASRSEDQSIRAYAVTFVERESKLSIDALLSRIDTFLFLKDTQAMLSAPSCVSFSEALKSGITIVDLGNPPAGVERVARFWSGLIIGRLTRAIMSRPVTEATRPAWIPYEEAQEAFGHDRADQFGRLLALSRYKKVSLAFINQQASQVAAESPNLLRLLQTNTRWQAVFRCNMEDAKAFTATMPFDGRNERRAFMRELMNLPRRHYNLWLKETPFGPQCVLSPKLDLARLHALAAKAPADVRRAIRQGTVAMPRRDLERLVLPPPMPTFRAAPERRERRRGSLPDLG